MLLFSHNCFLRSNIIELNPKIEAQVFKFLLCVSSSKSREKKISPYTDGRHGVVLVVEIGSGDSSNIREPETRRRERVSAVRRGELSSGAAAAED